MFVVRPAWTTAAIVSAFLAFTVGELSAAVSPPQLNLDSVDDPKVAAALAQNYNLPEIVASSLQASENLSAAVDIERGRLVGLLKSFGYLHARVDLVKPDTVPSADAALVELKPVSGGLFRIGAVQISGLSGNNLAPLRDDLRGIVLSAIGQVARGDVLADLEKKIVWRVRASAHPYAEVATRELLPDPTVNSTIVRISVDPGPTAKFGAVKFDGLARLDAGSLDAYVPFSPGDPFSPELLSQFGETLKRLPALRRVNVSLADAPDEHGLVDVDVSLDEAPLDPGELSRSRSMGMAMLAILLVTVGARQAATAYGVPARSPKVLFLTGLAVILFVVSASFVIDRVLLLANIG